MKNYIKIVISVVFVGLLAISMKSLHVDGASRADILAVEQEINATVDESTRIDLYGKDEDIIAEYYSLKNTGYVIFEINTNEVIEFSTENDNLFLKGNGEKVYYGGPLSYFKETHSSDTLVSLDTNQEVSKDVAVVEKNAEDVRLNPRNRSIPTSKNFTYKTAHTPKTFKYNPTGICGSTASAILLMYYHDYNSSRYVPSNLVTADGVALTKYLIQFIEKTRSSNVSNVVYGLNNYLNKQKIVGNVRSLSVRDGANKLYDSKYPIIVGTYDHPTYKNHWVVGYGFNSSNGLVNYFIVNNGWGQNGININVKYVDVTVVI